MAQAAVDAGAPSDTIGCLSMCTMEATNELMHNDAIKLIIATGGPGMVKAAYSAGKPAIGVGAGNSPSYIERTADVKKQFQILLQARRLIMVLFAHQNSLLLWKSATMMQLLQN